ncbi:histidine phosphatase family protein [Hydrogenophaga crassostreae]|uniref:Histidine phosphatase family protein n=1 Tax=Hydrogenophaga crassostreae TaxID=1763535 RepID=A0A162VW02_9BURK|nr:histidine phosphatase family protein [Hydrogenophaga crassostreae]AOW15445.1 histidine phosphatase family protein [Hydrogenophaga crassostreae]OAD40649.1 histidine phosphatase family protein [Hydrogenophaga crassostreae]
MSRRQFQAAVLGLTLGSPIHAQAQSGTPAASFWALLREGGNLLLMRHAQTVSGTGDPANFRIGDCSTQRNLSEAGREQARRVAVAFQREGVVPDEVRSSAWCRCVDTAELAFGRHTVWAPINSFFQQNSGERQTREALQSLQQHKAPRNLVLVTHQVNISALTGNFTVMGEMLLARPEHASPHQLEVLARQTF